MAGPWRRAAKTAMVGVGMLLGAAAMFPAQAQDASSDILKQVLERGTVRVGECMGLAPFGVYNANNEPEGYDIDIANELGASLGVKVEIVNVDPAARIPSLETGKVDVVFCDTTSCGFDWRPAPAMPRPVATTVTRRSSASESSYTPP